MDRQLDKDFNDFWLFELFFKYNLASVAILDRNFNFIRVNEAYAKADGRDVSEFPGRNHFDMYPSEAVEIFQKVVREKEPFHTKAMPFVYPHSPIRGVTFWDWSLIPLLDKEGEVEFLILFLIDVTGHKRAEENLRISEERFNKIFSTSPVAMSLQDLENGLYLEINSAFEAKTGFSRQEVLGRTPEELNLWEDNMPFQELLNGLDQSELGWRKEISFRKKTGEIHVGHLWYVVVDYNDQRCLFSALKDITEEKLMERRIARMEQLNLIGQMAASIGHEVRNPMTTIRGFLQLFRAKEQFSEFKPHLDLMIEELDRANLIITEFLSLAKDKRVDKRLVNLNDIIDLLLLIIQADALKNGVRIQVDLGTVPPVNVDDNEIKQLLLNLVRNGVEAMPSGGCLTISTFQENDHVVLMVKDQGPGIDQEVLDKIGTPFYTTKENGTGLGLAVCYSIAARHDAEITIDTSHMGATVFVKFPIPVSDTMRYGNASVPLP